MLEENLVDFVETLIGKDGCASLTARELKRIGVNASSNAVNA